MFNWKMQRLIQQKDHKDQEYKEIREQGGGEWKTFLKKISIVNISKIIKNKYFKIYYLYSKTFMKKFDFDKFI